MNRLATHDEPGSEESSQAEGGVPFASSSSAKLFMESCSDAIFIVDEGGLFRQLNGSAAALFSVAAEELSGCHPRELQWSESATQSWEKLVTRVLETGGAQRAQFMVTTGDGERQVDWRASPLLDAEGLVLVLGRDISELCTVAREKAALESRIHQTQRLGSLGVLAGEIAHDFNNLLMGVLGHAEIASRSLSNESMVSEQIDKIITSAKRSSELCQQLLVYTEKGDQTTNPLDLVALVEEMTQLLEVSITKKAQLNYTFSEQLPAILGDGTLLRQVILNLIVNASEAIGDDDGRVDIELTAVTLDGPLLGEMIGGEQLEAGEHVRLRVSDNGSGMDSETLSRMFDPFFTTKSGGRGLGLAAVVGIVKRHDGALRVKSEPGQGTTFEIFFPALDHPVKREEAPEDTAETWRGEGTVLVVDDEPNARRIAQLFLEEVGFDVLVASDGREGIEAFTERADDIVAVVLDLTMPHIGGEEAFRQIRDIRKDAPVILSSGYSEQDVIQRFSGQPWAGFIQKPYRFAALINKIKEILR